MEKTLDEAIGIAKIFLLGASVLYIKEYIYDKFANNITDEWGWIPCLLEMDKVLSF